MFIRLQKGITLIEVLIAAGVLALIMGSTVALGRSVTRNQIITQDRAQALALTVEAAEIIRNLRDSTYVDQTQNRFNEFLASANCANVKCDNLEISWDSSVSVNDWFIESNKTPLASNPGEGGALPLNQETDNDPNGEVIVVEIGTGDVSDNTSRVVGTAGFKDAACSSLVSGSLIYCRKITLMPIVFDDTGDAFYDPTVDNKDSCVTDPTGIVTCKTAVIPITEEDPAVKVDSNTYTFDAYVNSSFKIISEISWNEFGTTRSVESTDIITNWR